MKQILGWKMMGFKLIFEVTILTFSYLVAMIKNFLVLDLLLDCQKTVIVMVMKGIWRDAKWWLPKTKLKF